MKAFLPSIVLNSLFLALLLGSAGRWDYWPAWVYALASWIMSFLTQFVLRNDPELLAERHKPKPNAKHWDKKLLALGFLLTIMMLVTAGLDAGRLQLCPTLTWPYFALGLILNLIGMSIFLRALKENRFFSSVVRIQSDRGHTVCNSGPYRLVRHPGYAGMVIGTLGLPLLLMSTWSAIPAAAFVVVLIVRTRLEDRVLSEELAGYQEYCQSTRYRLIPGVW